MNLKQVPLGVKENIAVLFCDMFNYTAICEQYSLEYVAELLNNYYCAMGKAVLESNGIIGSFVGDAVIGYFGILDAEHACQNAVIAALSILERSEVFNLPDGQPVLNGVGIAVGELMVTTVGPVKEIGDNIVIGKPINEASRLEKLTRYSCHRMLLTGAVFEQLDAAKQKYFVRIGQRYVRGIDDSMILYGEMLKY